MRTQRKMASANTEEPKDVTNATDATDTKDTPSAHDAAMRRYRNNMTFMEESAAALRFFSNPAWRPIICSRRTDDDGHQLSGIDAQRIVRRIKADRNAVMVELIGRGIAMTMTEDQYNDMQRRTRTGLLEPDE